MKKIKFLSLLLILSAVINSASGQDYPPFNATVYDTSSSGYYFLVPWKIGLNPNGINSTQMILDKNGRVVYYKVFPGNMNPGSFTLQPNGLMSYSYQGNFYFMDSSFTILDSVYCKNGITTDGHDMVVLPNGHFLILGTKSIQMNLSMYYMFNNNGTPGSSNATLKYNVIQELDANKNVVFEWHAKDYFAFDDVDEAFLKGPAIVDWTHCNALELDTDGNILLSTRHFNEITKISRTDSSIIWRLGGKKNQFNFLNDPQMFKGQHDIRRIANGNITLFDNGNGPAGNPFHPATAKEYLLDEILLTADLTWSYIENPLSYSPAMGNTQRLPNGNTLVNFGLFNNSAVMFSSVKNNGQKVFDITFNDTLLSYRSFNYPVLPWSLNRPAITCYQSGSQYYLDAGSGYAGYKWSNGATTQSITVTSTGTFNVFVPTGTGGFLSSDYYEVTSLTNPCNLSAVSSLTDIPFSIYPNPVSGALHFTLSKEILHPVTVEIFNVLGLRVFSSALNLNQSHAVIPVSELQPGIYFLSINGLRKKFIKY